MKSRYLALVFAPLFSAAALAGYTGPGGGAASSGQAAATQQTSTVAQAAKAADDTKVVLEGHIVRKLDSEHYEFKDATGTIKVEIDDKKLPAESFSESTKVRLYGEVDTHRTKDTDIDVDRVEVVK